MLIQDLSKELDTKALTAVRGGNNSTAGVNTVGQLMNLCAPVMIGTMGPSNTNIDVSGTQNASIGNFQFAGDSYLAALLPVRLER